MKIKALLIFLLTFLVSFANNETDELIKKAKEEFNDGKIQKAIVSCEKAISIDKKYGNAYILLCEIYVGLNDYKNAFKYAKNANKLGNDYPLLIYYAGYSLLRQGKYLESKSYYDQFNTLKISDDSKKEIAKIEATSCSYSFDAIKNPLKIEYKKLKGAINTPDIDEFSPSLSGNTIYFLKKTSKSNLSIYKSKVEKSKWSEATELDEIVDSDEKYNGVSVSYPEKYLFFSGFNGKNYDIYYSVRTIHNKWSRPESIGKVVNTMFDEMSPACFYDGENISLVFSSNRIEGTGYDLWCTKLRKEGSWEPPMKLGTDINTPFDETAPFVSHDGSFLIYSSNGLIGFGGKDFFISKLDEEKKTYTKPKNLGYPINDFSDNEGICVTPDLTAIIASFNKGYRGYDLYYISLDSNFLNKTFNFGNKLIPEQKINKTKQQNKNYRNKKEKIKEKDTINNLPISIEKKIETIKDTIENKKNSDIKDPIEIIKNEKETKKDTIEFKGNIKNGYEIKSDSIEIKNKFPKLKTQIKIDTTKKDSIKNIKNIDTTIIKEKINKKSIKKSNIFIIKFSYEEYKILGKKLNEFNKIEIAIKEQKPNEILVIGYPDGKGEEYFNGELARARALYATNLLKKKFKKIKISSEYKKTSNKLRQVEISLVE